MDFVSSLRRLLDGSDRSNSHDTMNFADKSTLEQLPGEILLIITEFLPSHCAAILALSSKSLCFKLGSKPLESFVKVECFFKVESLKHPFSGRYFYPEPHLALTQRQMDHSSFLTLLSRDLPDEVFCHSCLVMHTPEATDAEAEERWTERPDGYKRK
jgi:hypothetical protein